MIKKRVEERIRQGDDEIVASAGAGEFIKNVTARSLGTSRSISA